MSFEITLLQELVKSNDSLQTIEFNFMEKDFKFYYKYLTLLEKARIEQFCVKRKVTYNPDGTKTETYEKDEEMYPVHLIIEKALNEDGTKIFSHTNPEHFKLISSLPYDLASYIAYHFTLDVFGTFNKKKEEE
jgi:hypothetical protein